MKKALLKMRLYIYFIYFIFLTKRTVQGFSNYSLSELCPVYKKGPNLNVADLVGSWMTVYTQPQAVECFKFRIRATTDLEREQNVMKYGNFSNRINWNLCFLQVETSLAKHFLQGNGNDFGLMENIIIYEDKPGEYTMKSPSADQWMIFGRRGSEVLVIRDCYGETAGAFARAPYWPTTPELIAIFHRSGITTQTYGRMQCEPPEIPLREYVMTSNLERKTTRKNKYRL